MVQGGDVVTTEPFSCFYRSTWVTLIWISQHDSTGGGGVVFVLPGLFVLYLCFLPSHYYRFFPPNLHRPSLILLGSCYNRTPNGTCEWCTMIMIDVMAIQHGKPCFPSRRMPPIVFLKQQQFRWHSWQTVDHAGFIVYIHFTSWSCIRCVIFVEHVHTAIPESESVNPFTLTVAVLIQTKHSVPDRVKPAVICNACNPLFTYLLT